MMKNGVYLIHFDRPFGHAQHYLGWTNNLEKRLSHHKAGTGSCLLRAVNLVGISWSVVRTWPDKDGHFERRLHNMKSSAKLCPICNPTGWANHAKE